MPSVLQKTVCVLSGRSLKIKLALLVCALVLVLAGGIGIFQARHFQQQLRHNLHQQQFSLVTALAGGIDDKLNLYQQALLTATPHFQDSSHDPDQVQEFLDQLHALQALFDQGLFLFSPGGDLIAEYPFLPGRRGNNYAFREYFQRTLASRQPIISSPYLSSKAPGPPSIMFTVPIFDQQNRLIAVMGGALNLLGDNFLGELRKMRLGRSGYLYLYDTDRTIIVHPDPTRILKQDVPKGANPLFDRAISGFEGTGETVTSRGLPVLASFKRIKATNWILAANYPTAEAYASLSKDAQIVGAILLPITLAILAISLVLLHRMLRPLQALTDQVRRLTPTLPGSSPSIIGQRNEIRLLDQTIQFFLQQWRNREEALLQARSAAEEERAKLDAIIAAIGHGLMTVDPEYRVLYQNQTSARLLGDILGEHCYRGGHQRHTPCPDCAVAKALGDGEIHSLERYNHRTGHTYELTASPVRDGEGKITAAIEIMQDITERKQEEQRLRQNEQQLAEAQRVARLGSYEWDLTSDHISWSAETYRIFGLSPEEGPPSFNRLLDLVAPEYQHRFSSSLAEALTENKSIDYNFQITRPDGAKRMIHAQARVIADDSGRASRMTGTYHDITQRWQSDELLRVLSAAVQQSPVTIVITDPEAQILYVNPRYTELTGYTPEEVLGGNPNLLASGQTPVEVYQELWRTIIAKKRWQGELLNRRKNGELYWEQTLISPICDHNGTTTHYLALKEDITEHKQTAQQLRKLSLAVEQSPALVMITSPEGIIEYINPKYTQVTGYAPFELIGRKAAELGVQNQETAWAMWQTLAAGGEWRGEFCNRKKTGEIFWETAAISPVRDKEGVTSHFVKVAEDVTERRVLEQRLRHAHKMEAVGQLAAGLAHDFNNLLTAIVGYANLQLLKAAEGSILHSDLKGIIAAANRGSKLIRDLLDFSRKNTPVPAAAECERIDLNALVRQSANLLQQVLGEQIALQLELGPGPLPTLANSNHLEQVLLNLGANARDAMPEGGRLELQTLATTIDQSFISRYGYGVPGQYAVLAVADTGCGIEPGDLDKIFDPFFTTKEVGKGTGLGLAITYGIIKQHRGFITCDSQPGQGTLFRLYIPQEPQITPDPPETLANPGGAAGSG